MSANPQLTFD